MKYNLYSWQENASKVINGKDAILSSPTGSGKSFVAYIWAGILDQEGYVIEPESKVIFTAPTKALSNERYISLKNMGLEVGLETGDFKKNTHSRIICCTQEIYTIKYYNQKNTKVIIDEFHYIFRESERSRAYIDGINTTNKESYILVMSATFGDIETVRSYLDSISDRNFVSFNNEERATDLKFLKKGVLPYKVKDSIVFVFSKKGIVGVSNMIADTRKDIDSYEIIQGMAEILEIDKLDRNYSKGVGQYYGMMLPKEKLLTELAYRNRLLDVVVGTDALALGVNLPAEYVLFAQLAKYMDGPISKNEFLQIAGRAGRKGFFDKGYVSFLKYNDRYEKAGLKTGDLYKKILNKECENATVRIRPKYGEIIGEYKSIKEEAEYIAAMSLPEMFHKDIENKIKEDIKKINEIISKRARGNKIVKNKLKDILSWSWDTSLSFKNNVVLADIFLLDNYVDLFDIVSVFEDEEKNYLSALLRAKSFVKSMDIEDIVTDIKDIDYEIESIDSSVFLFEERINEIRDFLKMNGV